MRTIFCLILTAQATCIQGQELHNPSGKFVEVPMERFVLVARDRGEGGTELAAFKFLRQGDKMSDLLTYRWISMYKHENVVSLENQNFLFGESTAFGRQGVRFEDYWFTWRPGKGGESAVIAARERKGSTIKFCLSNHSVLWGVDLEAEIERIERDGAPCVIQRGEAEVEAPSDPNYMGPFI